MPRCVPLFLPTRSLLAQISGPFPTGTDVMRQLLSMQYELGGNVELDSIDQASDQPRALVSYSQFTRLFLLGPLFVCARVLAGNFLALNLPLSPCLARAVQGVRWL